MKQRALIVAVLLALLAVYAWAATPARAQQRAGAVTDTFHITDAAGDDLTGAENIPATGGWQDWTTVTGTVQLSAGQQTLIVDQDNGGWNIRYLSFASSGISASTNLALNQPVTASGYTQTYVPSNAVDGNTSTYWESTDNDFPQWFGVDLGSAVSIDQNVMDLPSSSWPTRTQTITTANTAWPAGQLSELQVYPS